MQAYLFLGQRQMLTYIGTHPEQQPHGEYYCRPHKHKDCHKQDEADVQGHYQDY